MGGRLLGCVRIVTKRGAAGGRNGKDHSWEVGKQVAALRIFVQGKPEAYLEPAKKMIQTASLGFARKPKSPG